MTSVLRPDAETVERTIEGTRLENVVHVLGRESAGESEASGRQWLPGRNVLSRGGEETSGPTGPYLLIDLGAIAGRLRGTARSTDVGETAADIAPEPGDDGDAESSGRGLLPKLLLVGVAVGIALALRQRSGGVEDPEETAESLAQRAASTIQQRGELAAERIEEGSQTVAERIEERGDHVSETAQTVETVEERATETVEDVQEGAAEVAEDVQAGAEEVQETAAETVEDVEEDAAETAEEAQEDVEEATDEVTDDDPTDTTTDTKYET